MKAASHIPVGVTFGRKGFAAVVDAFWGEASNAFTFLAGEFGLNGPERSNLVIPAITFTGGGVRYEIMLDTREKNVDTSVEVDLEPRSLTRALKTWWQRLALAHETMSRQKRPR